MAIIAPEAAPPQEPSRSFIAVNLAICSLLWGSSYLFIKLMSGEVSALAIAASRGVLGAAVLSLWSLGRGRNPLPRRAEIVPWIMLGTTNGWLPNVLVGYALVQLASGPAAMIQAAGPLVTALVAHLVFSEERLNRRRLGGILLGMIGVALLIGPRLFEGGGTALSVLAMIGAKLSYTVANLYVRTVPAATGDPARLALGQQMFSGSNPDARRRRPGGLRAAAPPSAGHAGARHLRHRNPRHGLHASDSGRGPDARRDDRLSRTDGCGDPRHSRPA